MNTFWKISSAILMVVTAAMAVADFLAARYLWGLFMVGCFYINYRTFRGTTRGY